MWTLGRDNPLNFISFPTRSNTESGVFFGSTTQHGLTSLKSIKKSKDLSICSVHFETVAYNCPTDIGNSRLLPTAYPTLIDSPHTPSRMENKRPAPKERLPLPPKKKKCSTPPEQQPEVLQEAEPIRLLAATPIDPEEAVLPSY
ncbi:hypothetical protein CAPTEDRAFT_194202 [Capitella teleta]|uniref:Uncharacterized protein n=1 Tax=Capitella teleta TaxID=283909 RepID=R7VA36_CAPTE|nr:hypothetical protein CAPTEDRAFT_194202 [Capitella teleta]|eukprot:ELU15668.1 hypothetical protein CAPTEDRAFT_194202 [Capitella teleta]